MLGEPRIATKDLASLSRRLGTALGAGVDIRNVWTRESKNAHGSARRVYSDIRDAVAKGSSVSEALDHSGNYFPEMFRELVRVGEESGQLAEVFRQLADNYEHQLQMRRNFLGAIAWPMFELIFALGVVGIVIYVMGAVPQLRKSGVDLIGFGLRGGSGLLVYATTLGLIAGGLFFVYRATTRGALWVSPVQRVLMRVPKLGSALETFSLARMTWAMHVTLNTGMDTRKALALSLASTKNVLYTQHTDNVMRSIRAGRDIHDTLSETGAFPHAFLDAVEVGEQSGMLAETMANMSNLYQEEARMAMRVIAAVMGFLVFVLVAVIIIFFIIRIANAYLGILNEAGSPI
jgi:type IV pilus assembly protein PilC